MRQRVCFIIILLHDDSQLSQYLLLNNLYVPTCRKCSLTSIFLCILESNQLLLIYTVVPSCFTTVAVICFNIRDNYSPITLKYQKFYRCFCMFIVLEKFQNNFVKWPLKDPVWLLVHFALDLQINLASTDIFISCSPLI